jgi:hypothetical protein
LDREAKIDLDAPPPARGQINHSDHRRFPSLLENSNGTFSGRLVSDAVGAFRIGQREKNSGELPISRNVRTGLGVGRKIIEARHA